MLIAKEVWASEEKAKAWIKRSDYIADHADPDLNTEIQSIISLINEVDKYKFNSFLEVGAGNGRLIGALSKLCGGDLSRFCSVDINPTLSKYVAKKYPEVKTYVGDASKLPFKDKEFDLVYTYQVLQHVPIEEMSQVLSELKRVAKELWLMEGYDPECIGLPNGYMRTDADGGTFAWRFDELLKCYEVSTPKTESLPNGMGVRLYKIKSD